MEERENELKQIAEETEREQEANYHTSKETIDNHIDVNKTERRFTFKDMKRLSNQAVNYFISLGIQKGDKVMLVLKRHYQFWPIMVALHNSSKECAEILNGDRIAQIVFLPYKSAVFTEVDDLDKTVRGTGGFGSTGTN